LPGYSAPSGLDIIVIRPVIPGRCPGLFHPAPSGLCRRWRLAVSQSLAVILVHLVFSTKNREPLITPDIEPELFPYMATVLRGIDSPSLAINGTADHVHILLRLSRKYAVAAVVEEVKTSSSKWIKTKGDRFGNFHWQAGYGAFSIGESGVAACKQYIAGQKEHHRVKTFQEEFRAFLKKYNVEYDERYVWD
jgi:putative transposase